MAINVTIVRQDAKTLLLYERMALALEAIALGLKPEPDPEDAERIAAATTKVRELTAALDAAIPKE